MTTDRLFTVAGVSSHQGETKVRFANDIMRVKILAKHGHTSIKMIEMETAMNKMDAVKFISGLAEFQDNTAQAAIADFLDRNQVKPAKVKTPAPKATKVKATKVKATKVKAMPAVSSSNDEDDDNKPVGYDTLIEQLGEATI